MQHLHFPEPALKAIAAKYHRAIPSAGFDTEDLQQVGREAVQMCTPKFDPDRGGKCFEAFAWMCANQAVAKFANEHRAPVRVPSTGGASRRRRVWSCSTSPTADRGEYAYEEKDDLLEWFGFTAEPTVDADLDAARQAARVRACIDRVTADNPLRGDTLRAVYLEGLSVVAVARARGVTHQAVQNVLGRARRDFKAAWLAAGWGAPCE